MLKSITGEDSTVQCACISVSLKSLTLHRQPSSKLTVIESPHIVSTLDEAIAVHGDDLCVVPRNVQQIQWSMQPCPHRHSEQGRGGGLLDVAEEAIEKVREVPWDVRLRDRRAETIYNARLDRLVFAVQVPVQARGEERSDGCVQAKSRKFHSSCGSGYLSFCPETYVKALRKAARKRSSGADKVEKSTDRSAAMIVR